MGVFRGGGAIQGPAGSIEGMVGLHTRCEHWILEMLTEGLRAEFKVRGEHLNQFSENHAHYRHM